MARPRQYTDEEILSAARACFLEHGASVSTAHIAGEIGLSQAALFKRFQTKENLLVQALAPPEQPPWILDLVAGPTDEPFDAQLERIAVKALTFLRELMPRVMVLKSAGLEPQDVLARYETPPPVLAMRLLAAFFQAADARGLARITDADATAMQFMGCIHVRAYFGHMFNLATSAEEDAAYMRDAVRTLCHGIIPREAS